MISTQLKNQHLMWRVGFGPAADQLEQLKTLSPQQLYKSLQQASAKLPASLDATNDHLKAFAKGMQNDGVRQLLDKEDRRNFQQQSRGAIKDLNLLWLDEMVSSKAQLREKVSLFWHGHFASRHQNVFYQQQMLDVVRQHALGSFRDLLHGVSKSAAMLNFLNAHQNRKGHPNENFAREVMELFTLGRGNYSERDVKEAARAFTGWGANLQGEFVFRKFQHDSGTKTVLGKTGNFAGEEVLDMLLEQKGTAKFLTQKIYRFFVNDAVDGARVEWLANRFYKNNYSIGQLLDDIFTADWFYDEKDVGVKIKSPVELIVGIRRMLPMEIENSETQLLVQKLLGQVLFYPPNVAGWPGGKTWIDSSTLMFRMRLPQLINDTDELNIRGKMDDDQTMGRMDEKDTMTSSKKSLGKIAKPIRAMVDWKAYVKNFEAITKESLVEAMSRSLLQVKPSFSNDLIQRHANSSGREAYVKTATLQIMSTPEYQLC